MTRLTRLALNNPSITYLLMAALIVAGLISAYALNQELIPDIQAPQATIVVVYPGASADEVTSSVVEPIENAMEEITDVDVLEVSSLASESFAAVTVLSEYGTLQDDIETAIRDQLEDVDLPEDAEEPEVILFNFADLPVLQASISGDIDLRDLQRLLEDEVLPELESVEGVSEVSITGDREDKIFLRLDPDALEEKGVSVSQIRNVLTANDLSFPAGSLESAGRVTPVQVTNRIDSAAALSRLIISTGDDGPPEGGPPGAGGPPPGVTGRTAGANAQSLTAGGGFPLPRELQVQAALLGLNLETTADLTPEVVAALEDESPALLRSAAEQVVDALPPGGFALLSAELLAALPEDLRADLADRAAANAAADEADSTSASDDEVAEDDDETEDTGSDGPTVRVVVVQPGETLATLSARFGTPISRIADANDLDVDDEIEEGTALRVPLDADGGLPVVWQLAGAEQAEEITPAILATVLAINPNALNDLSETQLLALPPETIEDLPSSLLARQDPDLLERLIDRRDGRADEAEDEEQAEEEEEEEAAPEAADSDEIPENWVRLGDVADVVVGPEASTTVNRTNGDTSLGLLVLKDRSANTVSVVKAVEDEIEVLQDDIPAFDELEVRTVFEQASFIEESLNGVRNEGLLGGIFAVLIILLFLSSVRSTLIIAISIPLSILTALLFMRIFGLTINLLTLSGLTIAIGRVVDDSIVVLENIYRNLQRGTRRRDAIIQGTKEVATAITAATLITVAVFLPLGYVGGLTREFFLPFALTTAFALLASLIVAVTIIPLLARTFLDPDKLPEEKESWLQRAYTPSLEWALDHPWITLGLSTLFFVLSLGLARFIPQNFIGGFGDPAVTVEVALPSGTALESTDAVSQLVEEILEDEEDLENYETTVGRGSTFFGEFSGGDPSKAFFFANFPDTEDQGYFERLFDDDPVDEPEKVAERVRDALAELNDLDEIAERLPSTMGAAEAERIVDDLRAVVADANLERGSSDGGVFEYTVSAGATGGPPGGVFDLRVTGEDEAQVREATALILDVLRDPEKWEDLDYDLDPDDDEDEDTDEDEEDEDEDKGFFERLFDLDDDDDEDEDGDEDAIGEDDLPIINLSSNLTEARRVLEVDVDPALALEQGLTTVQVAFILRSVFEGDDLGKVELLQDGERDRLEVVATYPDDLISDKAGLENYLLDTPNGDQVRLGDIATVALADGSVEITRVDGERAALITGEILDEDVFGIIADANTIIDELKEDHEDLFGEVDADPDEDDYEEPAVLVGAGVESSQQQEGFSDLLLALPVSILIVYLIMVIEFGSLATPFVILFSLPFALTGALAALAITQRALSISSMIGVLMLVGIVVTNAIVLLDFVKQLRDQGYDLRTALVEGGRTRIRPIIMTALATIIALIPLALGFTEGAIIAEELATTVIGGLLTSTLLTLVVVPVVYQLISGFTDRDFFDDEGDGPELPPFDPTPAPGRGGGVGRSADAPEVPTISTPPKPAPDPFAPPAAAAPPPPPSGSVAGTLGGWQAGAAGSSTRPAGEETAGLDGPAEDEDGLV